MTAEPVGDDPIDRVGATARPAVRVIRSRRRTKTSQARLVDRTLEIRIPAHLSARDEAETVAYFVDRFARRTRTDDNALANRAAALADRYGLPRPASVRWVSNQARRWGSCTPANRTIRLSDRMAAFPDWVVDYVLVHELAHLVVLHHSPEFWAIVERYPLTERARGFLIAKAWDA